MSRNVNFSDEVIAQAADIAPSFEFSKFAQAAVREKIDKMRHERELTERLAQSDRDAN